jgi:glycerol-3-phosphate O-acyltransferase
VAFEVAVRINRVTPATATAQVTLALLGVRDRALTLRQVRQVLEPLRTYLVERNLPRSGAALATETGVRRVLGALAQQHVVTVYDGGVEPVYAIEQGQHLVAAFYRNSAIHHFIDRAVAELVLLSPPAERWDEAMRLRDQLKFEFFFPDKESYRAQLSAELDRLDPAWPTADGRAVLERSPLLMAHRVLRSFLDAQLVVAERLAARGQAWSVAEKEFLNECGGVGRQMLLQGRLHGPESLSRELFSAALQLAANHDLIAPDGAGPDRAGSGTAGPDRAGPDRAGSDGASPGGGEPPGGGELLAERRQAFAARLRELVARVITIDEIDAASRREAVGVEP